MPLAVELVSPERTLFSGDASMVRARTVGGGDIAFLSGHAPFVGALAIATVEITLADGGSEKAAVHGGFIEVSNDHVKILSDLAELALQVADIAIKTGSQRFKVAFLAFLASHAVGLAVYGDGYLSHGCRLLS